MNAGSWYSIVQTVVFDTSCVISITFGNTSSVILAATIKYGMCSLNINNYRLEQDYNISLRLREYEGTWSVDMFSNKDITPVITTNSQYWNSNITPASNGTIIAVINNIIPDAEDINTENLFSIVNVGTEYEPVYTIVAKRINNQIVHIVSEGEITAGGSDFETSPESETTTIGSLFNVDSLADQTPVKRIILVREPNATHWTVMEVENINGYDDTALRSAVITLRTDFDTLVSGDTTTAIKSFNEVIAFLNNIEDNQSLGSIIASIEQQIAGKQDNITDIATIRENATKGGTAVQPSALSKVATSGSYNDLSDKPTKLSQFDNDSKYITLADISQTLTNLQTEINNLKAFGLQLRTLDDGTKVLASPYNFVGDKEITSGE